ncbi:AbrB/MazE/SpoVT family DNA-binding domain-containing protein [Polynucleobacter sp. MWH-S4W17]|jgi:antitoxin MazE|uniref:AbrB/MazE/SpoVT family DNA-binding domain-containing protein n=1 Tax=Polynucleobacter sp. MWH-S4W17 TaxID=1855910 RepID=UPI001BFE2E6C|nr:AbrB/MazE/SpoVT family DNA-binding domain-containing protein [Polynucleobacter sp. MWH-S4W17]
MNKSHKSNAKTRAPLQVAIRAIGNSKGVVIPKIILDQSGLKEIVEMSVDGEKIILSKPKNTVREHWAQDAQSLAKVGEDNLVLGDFANEDNGDWAW